MVLLYDPKTNILSETTYEYLVELTGMMKGSLMSARSKGRGLGVLAAILLKMI